MSVHVPRVAVVVFVAVLLAGATMMFLGAGAVGVTWDEKTHVLMLDTFFSQGWNVTPDALLPDGTPDPAYIWGVYVYGPVGELVAHAVATAIGQENWANVSYDAGAYAARHLGIALMALVGVIAAGLVVRVITRSWAFALLGAAMLAMTPLWVGHGMFNIKDIPVASGYTLATLGVVLFCCDSWWRDKRVLCGAVAALALGSALAAGTRAAVGVPIAGAAFIALVLMGLLLAMGKQETWLTALRTTLARLVAAFTSLAVAYVLLLLIYPKAFINPVVLAWQALVVSSRFPFDEAVLTAGVWMNQPPPPTYLPYWFGAQLPILVLVGAAVFLLWWIVMLVRSLAGRETSLPPARIAMASAVLLQVFMLPILAVVMKSNMYNGSRQFLFVIPAVAIAATLGVWLVARWLSSGMPKARWLSTALWTVVSIGVVVPVLAQSTLFPYNFVFYNAPTAIRPIDGHWPMDYWRASSRELMQRLPAIGAESCAYEQGRKGELHPCSQEPMFSPFLAERGTDALPGSLQQGGYWLIRENQGVTSVPEGCTLHDSVDRRLWTQEVVIGQVFKCGPA